MALQSALCILQPDAEFGWLTARLGLLPVTLGSVQIFDSAALEAWGHEPTQGALRQPQPLAHRTQYRNGLLIAILATPAPRLRALAAMRLGRQVVRDTGGGGWQLAFRAEDIKTQRPVEYALPAGLGPCIERYLAVGAVFGPHRFRHSLAAAAYADPANPGLAAAVLAISELVIEAHYNQARDDQAVRRFHEVVRRERVRTAPWSESGQKS